jgi:hypothetical protein
MGVLAGFLGFKVWNWTHTSDGFDEYLTFWNSLAAGVGVFSLAALAWAFRGASSRGRRRCPRCDYDMAGGGLLCPECGHEAGHTSALYRRRRKPRIAVLAALGLLLAAGLQGVPRVREGGWRAAIPATVIISFLPWMPDTVLFEDGPNTDEDWTLRGRLGRYQLWEWQARWAESRAMGVAMRTRSVRTLSRALHTLEYADPQGPWVGPAIDHAAAALVSSDSRARALGADCLGLLLSVGVDGHEIATLVQKHLDGLIALVNNANSTPAEADIAAGILAVCGDAARPAADRLLELMGTSAGLRRYHYSNVLGALARASPEIKARVIRAIDDMDLRVAEGAMRALVMNNACDAAVAGKLLATVGDPDDGRALAAARQLCHARWDAAVVLPLVLEQASSSRLQRAGFIDRVSFYEEEALRFVPQLIRLLEDDDPAVRSAAIETLDSLSRSTSFDLDRSAAYPILVRLVRDPDPAVSRTAVDALGNLPGLPDQPK